MMYHRSNRIMNRVLTTVNNNFRRETEDLLCSLYEASPMNLFIVSIRKASGREAGLNNLISVIYY